MVAGTSHRFQRWAPVLLLVETVASGIYNKRPLQPKADSVAVAVAIFPTTESKMCKNEHAD
jgi:hypothetical protein